MLRPRSAASLVASLALVIVAHSPALAADALEQARVMLAGDDARGAVAVLERALPAEAARRGPLLDLLRKAYALAARQAESSGKVHDAEMYRDNLEILNRKPRPAAEAPRPAAEAPRPLAEPPRPPADDAVTKSALPGPADEPARSPAEAAAPKSTLPPAEAPPPAFLAPSEAPVRPISDTAELAPPPAVAPPAENPAPPPAPEATVAAADAAFVAQRYDEAGRIYGALMREKKLPASRRDHLAYCRCADVVRRINARPTRAEDWERIDAEIRQIRELSPNNWYGEYLRNLASERSPAGRTRPSKKVVLRDSSPKVVLRGSAPEEPPASNPPTQPGRLVAAAEPPAGQAPAPAPASAATGAGRVAATPGGWQVHETANFRIMHADPALAERVAKVAEEARETQVKRWVGPSGRGAWSPRCDIYVYPSAKVFSRMTNQPEDSPGFSTMGLNAGRIIARRINVRADHANLLAAIVPHEITHVVLADLFPHQQIPRWADEGMAVLSEPPSEQRLRAADLEKPLASGRLFKLNELMVMDYPDGKYWGLYYAQSVSLTRFLVDQGTPAQFVKFVQGAQQHGLEAALKQSYRIEGFDDLQKRWLAYARTNTSESTAAANAGPAATANRE